MKIYLHRKSDYNEDGTKHGIENRIELWHHNGYLINKQYHYEVLQ